MPKMNFSERVNGIFTAMDTTYEEMSDLMLDVALGRDIYDGERKTVRIDLTAFYLKLYISIDFTYRFFIFGRKIAFLSLNIYSLIFFTFLYLI